MSINNLEHFKRKITAGEICVGTVISLSDPTVSELSADAGFDFTWIDLEHSSLSLESAMLHVMAVRGTECAPFIRVPKNDFGVLKPVLDIAPAGVIIPMVNSAEEAEAAVAYCRYPKTGMRGFGIRRGNRYGMTPTAEYMAASESEPLVIIQIEHIDAVSNLNEILAVKGIDSICVGPCDLSGSMGIPLQMDNPELNAAIDEICRKCREQKIMLGTASAPFAKWKARGVDWIALTGDCGSLMAQSHSILEDVQREGKCKI